MTGPCRTIGAIVLSGALADDCGVGAGTGRRGVHRDSGRQDRRRRSGERAGHDHDRPQDAAKRGGRLVAAFKTGGAAALRKGLVGMAPTGTVKLGAGSATPTRFTIERATGAGRLLTILTDQPLFFVGAGTPGAKPKEGYDFAVIDIEIDGKGNGSGTLAPAAKLKVNQTAFVVEDYGAEAVRLTAVKKTK